jgi:hypothetical protein
MTPIKMGGVARRINFIGQSWIVAGAISAAIAGSGRKSGIQSTFVLEYTACGWPGNGAREWRSLSPDVS